jgi:hypothetical protein
VGRDVLVFAMVVGALIVLSVQVTAHAGDSASAPSRNLDVTQMPCSESLNRDANMVGYAVYENMHNAMHSATFHESPDSDEQEIHCEDIHEGMPMHGMIFGIETMPLFSLTTTGALGMLYLGFAALLVLVVLLGIVALLIRNAGESS